MPLAAHVGSRRYAGDLPLLQILNPCDAALGISHHLTEEKREGGTAELAIAAAVQVSVIDGFAVGGDAQAGTGTGQGRGLDLLGGVVLMVFLRWGGGIGGCSAEGEHSVVSWLRHVGCCVWWCLRWWVWMS